MLQRNHPDRIQITFDDRRLVAPLLCPPHHLQGQLRLGPVALPNCGVRKTIPRFECHRKGCNLMRRFSWVTCPPLGYSFCETSLKRLPTIPCSMMDDLPERSQIIGRLLEIRNQRLGTDLPEGTHHCEKGCLAGAVVRATLGRPPYRGVVRA